MSLKEDLALEAAREGNLDPLFDLESERKALRQFIESGCQPEPYDDSWKNWTAEEIAIAERLADYVGIAPCFRFWRKEEEEE